MVLKLKSSPGHQTAVFSVQVFSLEFIAALAKAAKRRLNEVSS